MSTKVQINIAKHRAPKYKSPKQERERHLILKWAHSLSVIAGDCNNRGQQIAKINYPPIYPTHIHGLFQKKELISMGEKQKIRYELVFSDKFLLWTC